MSYTVLMYHEIRKGNDKVGDNPLDVRNKYVDTLPTPLYIDYNDFVAQIDYLITNDYHFLSLEEVKSFHSGSRVLPPKSVLISFDDAFQSVLEYAYPILKDNRIRATLFVVSSWLNDTKQPYQSNKSRTLTYEEVLAMKDVFELANHTHELHERTNMMRSNLMDASIEKMKVDLFECSKYVDFNDMFAYPFGLYDEETIEKLKACGVKFAFTSNQGINTKDTDPFYLHRFAVFYGCTVEQFKEMLV